MKKFLLLLLFVGAGVFASTALATGGPPWGQDPCSHGSTGKQCKPDPQPDKGKDCEKHGKNGGVNEDHCKGTTPPPPCTVNCTPPPPCKVNCTPNPPKQPPTVAKCPINTTPIQANPLVCLKVETKTRVVPQCYTGPMVPTDALAAVRDITKRGVPDSMVTPMYDGAALQPYSQGFIFTQGRLK